MRYLFGFLCVCALVGTSPLSVSAQAGEEGADAKSTRPAFAFIPEHLKQRLPQHRHKPAPSSEPASEEPALQLKLDAAGVDVVPSPPRTPDGYTLEEMELRVRRAKIGLGVSGGAMVVGLVMTAAGFASYDFESSLAPAWTGVALLTGGFFGTITAGIILRGRDRKLRELQEAHYGTPRRVQWDLARSRVVF